MNLSTIPVVRLLIQQLLNHGVRHIVIAPGSRNAPITVGLTTHKSFTTYSIVDERSAGFFAIGLSQQIHQPVAVLCTSGSALLNIYPARAKKLTDLTLSGFSLAKYPTIGPPME